MLLRAISDTAIEIIGCNQNQFQIQPTVNFRYSFFNELVG